MHLLGRSIRVDLNPGRPDAKLLLEIPRWSFHWQAAYLLETPVQRRARRHAARDVPPRRVAPARHATLRALGRGDDRRDVPRGRPGDAPVTGCGSSSSRRCTRAATPRSSGSFVAALEHGLEDARARAGPGGRRPPRRPVASSRRSPATSSSPRGASAPTSSTRTSSSRPACSPCSRAGRRSSLTAHGQDVENARTSRLVRRATTRSRCAVRPRSSPSRHWLRGRLEEAVPEARGRTEVIDCGVDLERFAPGDAAAARAELGWQPDGTAFVCAGSLSERKNVVRLARAFARRGEGSLAFVGDGPLRPRARGPARRDARRACPARRRCRSGSPPRTSSASRASSSRSGSRRSRGWPPAARSSRRVSAARPSSCTDGAGVLVDPLDEDALAAALDAAAALPRPEPRRPGRGRAARPPASGRARRGAARACGGGARAGRPRRARASSSPAAAARGPGRRAARRAASMSSRRFVSPSTTIRWTIQPTIAPIGGTIR